MNDLIALCPVPPGWLLLCGAPLLYFLSNHWRRWFAIGLASVALLWGLVLPASSSWVWNLTELPWSSAFDYDVVVMQMSTPTRLFGLAFALLTLLGAVFSFSQNNRWEPVWAFVYAGFALSIVYTGDLITFFVYWEGMALSSALMIFNSQEKRSGSAGLRYLMIHLLGGAILLSGICAHIWTTGSAQIPSNPLLLDGNALAYLRLMDSPAAVFMLIGVLINAGVPILTTWLQDTYPEASPSGAVFLSGMTTKVAIFALLMFFSGAEVLLYVGGFMALYGVIYGLAENDLRRLLSFSIISQMGYMVCAVGLGTEFAINAVALYALVHILYKALLMMTAGAVIESTGCRLLSRLGGLRHRMPWVAASAMLGGLTLSALPLTGGYHSKTMLMNTLQNSSYPGVSMLLLATSAVGLIYVGLRYPWLVFMGESRGATLTKSTPKSMKVAMGLAMVAIVLVGVFPSGLSSLLPYSLTEFVHAAGYWNIPHLIGQLQMLLVAAVLFFWWLPSMMPQKGILLEADWLYRSVVPSFWCCVVMPFGRRLQRLEVQLLQDIPRYLKMFFMPDRIDYQLEGQFNLDDEQTAMRVGLRVDRKREWSIGGTLLVLLAILVLYLTLFFWRRATAG